ncbi:MAG: DnaJ C-terminal domain-containing protein [Myxococcota bacterium]
MKFQDYYETLGVKRSSTPEEIKKAYRRLSKEYHPDRNKSPGAEETFKKVSEAYEVLKDPQKRARYDQVGRGFHEGDDFRAPPGWQNVDFNFGQRRGRGSGPGSVGFSDFFETLFGSQGPGGFGGFGGSGAEGARARERPRKGKTTEVEVMLSLADVYRGGSTQVTLQHTEQLVDGGRRSEPRSFTVKLPPGTKDGTRIRLVGKGGVGLGGGPPGDLVLRVRLASHPVFEADGVNLRARLQVSPWEAALGAKVSFQTLDGEVRLTLPPRTQGGRKLRLKGKGLPTSIDERGDLELEVSIRIPTELSADEQKLFEKLAAVSNFQARG